MVVPDLSDSRRQDDGSGAEPAPGGSRPLPKGPWPRFRVHRGLGLRLTLLLAVLLTLAGSALAYLAAEDLRGELLGQAQLEALRLADTIKRSTRNDMLTTRSEDVTQTVFDIGGQPGIEHVRIYNKAGTITYSSTREEISRSVDLTAEACYQCHAVAQPLTHLDQPQRTRIYRSLHNGRVLAAIEVIYNEPSCSATGCHASPEEQRVLGVVDVGVSLVGIDERIAAAGTRTLVVWLLATVLVCALIGLFVYSFVTRPLRRLLRGIRRVSHGDLEGAIPDGQPGEVGALSSAFNQMTDDLRKARRELEDWARTLEQQVEERTRDLRVAQAQVVRAEKLSSLGTLAAGVAHELNSPLTGILTFAHLLLQDSKPGSREREDLQLIVNETQRCASIIRQLLQFAREGEPGRKPQDVVEVIQRALALVSRQAIFHRVEIDLDAGEGGTRCSATPTSCSRCSSTC
ncbi:MAG: histidine kinase dimerization/phospho-acceptor domain-containing protein [Planctomycetota bacterium]